MIKIVFVVLINIIGTYVNVFASSAIHNALLNKFKNFSFLSFSESINSMSMNKQHLQVFLLIQVVILLSSLLIFTIGGYKTKQIVIVPNIKIPAPAGQGQYGTARFMTNKEIDNCFSKLVINPEDDLIKYLLYKGDCKYKEVYHEKITNQMEKSNTNTKAFKDAGLIIGKKDKYNNEIMYCINGDFHSLILGATRSGKTRCLVIQSICSLALAGESIIATDPKGELYTYTKSFLEELGYDIFVLDFENPTLSNCYNPLQNIINAINDKNIDLAQTYAWDLTCFLVERSERAEPIWQNGEMSVIAAAILCVVYDNVDRPEYQNLTNVYWFIANMCKPVQITPRVTVTPIIEYIKILPDDHPAKPALGISQIAPAKTAGSFYTSALTSLRLYTAKDMFIMTNKSDFTFTQLGKRKTALFFIVPDQNTTYYPIVTLMVSQQYEQLVKLAKLEGNRLPIRTNFILDEFGNFTKITDFQTKLTVAGGYGIRFNLFLQDFNQLDEKYNKEVAAIIRGNCHYWIYLASTDSSTLETIEKRLGDYTTSSCSTGATIGRYTNSSQSQNISLQGRKLLKSEEIGRITRPYQLVLSNNYPCIMYSPDLSLWHFNKMLGLGNVEHNVLFIKKFKESRPIKNNRNVKMMIDKPWLNFIPTEY